MSRIIYLVSATQAQGIKDAMARGWQRIGMVRFATPEKDDVRVVSRVAELIPMAGKTPMVRGSDYEDGPESEWEMARWAGNEQSVGEKTHFDRFVEGGAGEWVSL